MTGDRNAAGQDRPQQGWINLVDDAREDWSFGNGDMQFEVGRSARPGPGRRKPGQDENTHGRFPGGGSTVRFVREAGWGNAMRYMLTGDHWTAQEAYRVDAIQETAATPIEIMQDLFGSARRLLFRVTRSSDSEEPLCVVDGVSACVLPQWSAVRALIALINKPLPLPAPEIAAAIRPNAGASHRPTRRRWGQYRLPSQTPPV